MDEISREKIEDIEYWRSLNPQSTITENPFLANFTPYEVSDNMDKHREQLKREGYFQTSPIVPKDDCDKLIKLIQSVVDTGSLSTYALLYDDFYHVAQKLSNILNPILGQGYQLVPDEFEAYLIDTGDEEMGSGPHRDSLTNKTPYTADGLPTLVNVWVALSDATPLNSCMYVLPGHLDPNYPRPGAQALKDNNRQELNPQNIRAVPVKAGSVLCWNTSLLHWGGRSSNLAIEPRFSFAMYFQRGDVEILHGTTMNIPGMIPIDYRLYLVEKVWRDPESNELYKYLPDNS